MRIGDRMKLLQLLSETVQDTIRGGWMRTVDFQEEDFLIRWHTDGTGTVETYSHQVLLRFMVEVTCSHVAEPKPPQRPWSQIPAGWLVEHPKQPDTWLKVLATRLVLGKQQVRLEFPDGRVGAFTYSKEAIVTCRPGEPCETDTALGVLGEGAYILEDEL